ncbi:MAG: M48 family metalloprotease [Candidatus Omnitrophica bacterium]|nr:M48 family metalloprotease [Candidatus Omnitrophota bacterium]
MAATLMGCATIYNPATDRQETVIDTPAEQVLGNIAKLQMGLVSLQMGKVDPEQMARVRRIGERLAKVSDRQDLAYQFGMIQDKELNAFTLPGGTIYVNSGLAEKADDDELAAVLGHEVGHAAARHTVKHLQADLGFLALVQIAAAAGAEGGALQVADSLYGLFSNGYSRRDELEADRLGIRYTSRAGYDPQGMVTFFEKMAEEERERGRPGPLPWERTHPLTSERIARAKEELQKQAGMFCPQCGREYGPEKKFCEKDGKALKPKGTHP